MNGTELIKSFNSSFESLKELAEKKIKEVKEISFSHLEIHDEETDEYYNEKPNVLVTNKWDETHWDYVERVFYDEKTDRAMMELNEDGIMPICYAEGYTSAYVYAEIVG